MFSESFLGKLPLSKRIINDDGYFRHKKSHHWRSLIVGQASDAHHVTSAMHICVDYLLRCLWFNYIKKDNYGFKRFWFFLLCIELALIESIDCITVIEPAYSYHLFYITIYFFIYCHNTVKWKYLLYLFKILIAVEYLSSLYSSVFSISLSFYFLL